MHCLFTPHTCLAFSKDVMYPCLPHRIALRPFKTAPKLQHVKTKKYTLCALQPTEVMMHLPLSVSKGLVTPEIVMDSDHMCSVFAFGSRVELCLCIANTVIIITAVRTFLMSFLCTEFLFIVQISKLRIFILPSTQTPEALQKGYRGRWQKRFEVIAHFSGEKGSDCLRSPSTLPVTASHATGERKKIKQLRERQRK